MNISLLHAGLAAGAALAAIPVILHLFMKQTPKHIIFPALQLIKERHKRSKKKLRIKNWLLLLARMALVALMALALARPTLYSEASLGDRELPTALGLVFDTSLSMEYTERNETRLAEAKKHASEILQKLPESSQVFVVDSAEPGAPPAMSPSAAKKRIDGLTLRPANRSLNAAVGQAYRAVVESDRPRHEVYVLTDLARSSWDLSRPVEGTEALKKVKFRVATFVLRLTPKDVHDLAVVEAQTISTLTTQGEPIEIQAQVRSSGAKASTVVEFFLDKDAKGNPVKKGQKPLEVPANGQVPVVFRTPSLAAGLHQGEIHVRGNDPMEFDDHRYFSIQVQPALKVLVVSERVLDAEFVAEAIDPAKLRRTTNRPFQVERVGMAGFAEKIKDSLKDYACVFLLNVRELPESEWGRLNAYVRDGGGVVIALGDRTNLENYNSPNASQVVPGTLEEKTKPKESVTFGKADVAHPLFNQYTKDLEADLSDVSIFRYWTVKPAQGARAILNYQNGPPALVERAFQGTKTGRVLLWTTPLSRRPDRKDPAAWNEFPMSEWSFLYLMNETVPYLAGIAGEKLNYEAGQDVVIPIDPSKRFTSYVVQHGNDAKTAERLSPLVSSPTLVIQNPQALGHWSVIASGPGRTPETLGFSVNPPEGETQVSPLETKDLESLFGKDNYHLADNPQKLSDVVIVERVGREIFPWIMLLILIVVTAENFLANKFYRDRQRAGAAA